jgi:hypothetical protein
MEDKEIWITPARNEGTPGLSLRLRQQVLTHDENAEEYLDTSCVFLEEVWADKVINSSILIGVKEIPTLRKALREFETGKGKQRGELERFQVPTADL